VTTATKFVRMAGQETALGCRVTAREADRGSEHGGSSKKVQFILCDHN